MKARLYAAALIAALGSLILPQQAKAQDSAAEPLWRQALGGKVLGSPETQARSVAMIGDDGLLRCYGIGGARLWTADAGGRLMPYLTRSREGTSYVGLRDGTLSAVNRSGRRLWRAALGAPLSSAVVVGWDGRLFVPEGNALSCYTAAGFRLWRRELGDRIALGPYADGSGGVLAATAGGSLLSIGPYGSLRLEELSQEPVALTALASVPPPASPSEEAGFDIAVFYRNGRGEIRLRDGQRRELPILAGVPVAAAGRGGKAAVLLQDGTVALASAELGRYLWMGAAAPAESGSRLLYDERGIYALTPRGAAGFTEDGRRLWFLGLRGTSGVPAFGDDGILYSGGADWILYAYKIEDRVRAQAASIFGPEPEGRYGPPPPSPWSDDPFGLEDAAIDRVLDEIALAVARRDIGEQEEAYRAYLMEIAGKGLPFPAPRPGTPPAVPPQRRMRALNLLSILGSRETVPFLADLFRREQDPAVMAAAADAMGRIGVDPEGRAMGTFAAAVLPPAPLRDDHALSAVASAVGALCRFSGPPLSDTGIRLLVALSADDRPPQVRNRAWAELASLR